MNANALLSASPLQIMELWEELADAANGVNGYGGDVAEIYIYRFMRHSPSVALDRVRGTMSCHEDYREANALLHTLCRIFEERRQVRIEMQEGPLDALLGPEIFDHRVHLVVKLQNANPNSEKRLENVSDEQLVEAISASVAPKTMELDRGMENYHCLSADTDDEVVPDERIAHVGGPDAELFYCVPIDTQRLRVELSKLLC